MNQQQQINLRSSSAAKAVAIIRQSNTFFSSHIKEHLSSKSSGTSSTTLWSCPWLPPAWISFLIKREGVPLMQLPFFSAFCPSCALPNLKCCQNYIFKAKFLWSRIMDMNKHPVRLRTALSLWTTMKSRLINQIPRMNKLKIFTQVKERNKVRMETWRTYHWI